MTPETDVPTSPQNDARSAERRTRSRAKSEATRLRIFDAAMRVFAERGFVETSLAAIAAEAGLEAGSLYYYYSSKNALIAAVLRLTIERTHQIVGDAVAELGEDAAPLDRIRSAILAHVVASRVQPDYVASYIRLIGQVPPEVRQEQESVERAYGSLWIDLIGDARRAGLLRDDIDPFFLTMLLLGSLTWTVEWPTLGSRTPEQIASAAYAVFVRGAGVSKRRSL